MNTTDKYRLSAVAVLLLAGLALWAGVPPILLILLVTCPLMMFFMMRGMGDDHAARSSDSETSHENIDRPER